MKIIIIGGVASGLTAAASLKRINKNLDVVVYEEDDLISYSTCSIPYFVSNEISNINDLILFTSKSIKDKKNISVKNNSRVIEINKRKKTVVIQDLITNNKIEDNYDKLIIATGAKQFIPEIKNIHSYKNVFTVKTLNDAEKIRSFIITNKPQNAVVIGSGFVGIEITEALLKNNISVDLIENRNQIFPVLPLSVSDLFNDYLSKFDVKLYKDNTVLEINSLNYKKCKDYNSNVAENENADVVITNKTKIKTDMIVLATGIKPEVSLADSSGIKICSNLGTIETNRKQQTNEHSIYAAGDCSNCYNYITNKKVYYPLATVARRQGEIAAYNAAGQTKSFKGFLNSWSLRFMNKELCQTGLTELEAKENGFSVDTVLSKEYTASKKMRSNNEVYVHYVFDKKNYRLLGSTLFGDYRIIERCNILATAIYSKLTLNDISNLDLSYSPPFNTVFDPIVLTAKKVV